jgi:hypothetical protein
MESEILLNSWKEIALYLGRSERTVQRWEKYFGLPVRRPAGKTRSAVFALPSEIQAWTRSTPRSSPGTAPVPESIFAPRLEPAFNGRPTLLCIDDHLEGLAVRKALFEAVGYNVLTASMAVLGYGSSKRNRWIWCCWTPPCAIWMAKPWHTCSMNAIPTSLSSCSHRRRRTFLLVSCNWWITSSRRARFSECSYPP